MRRIVAFAAVLLLAGCGRLTTTSFVPASATSAPVPSTTAGEPPLADEAELKDRRGDVYDLEGRDAPRTPHVDIMKVTAAADGHHLRVVLHLAGDVPKKLSSLKEAITYGIDMTVNDSGDIDYSVQIANLEGGNWDARLVPWFNSAAIEYPPPMVDGVVGFIVPLSSLGDPTTIRLSVIAQRLDHPEGNVLVEDTAKWLRLGK